MSGSSGGDRATGLMMSRWRSIAVRARASFDPDIVANLSGRILTALIAFVFLPAFLRILGAEGYGLVGFYTLLVGLISLLDLGLGMTLNREMARLGQGADACQARRDTLRSLEAVYGLFVLATGLAVVLGAPVLVSSWLHTAEISRKAVETSVRLMGVACVFQLVGSFYQGGLFGLQRQVSANTLMVGFTLLRQAGSLALLAALGPRTDIYFAAQAIGYLAQAVATSLLVRRAIGRPTENSRFRWSILRSVKGFALSVSGASVLGAGLAQLDRLVASGTLPLKTFAFYTVAASLAGLLYSIIQSVGQAFFPRLTGAAASDPEEFSEVLHQGSRVMAALLVPVAVVLAAFSEEAIFFWTRNREAAEGGKLVGQILVIGVLLNGLASLPATSLFAAGRAGVMFAVNAAFAVVLVPAAWLMAAAWGGAGAAATALLLNLGYLFTLPPLMRRHGLRLRWGRWSIEAVLLPVSAAALAVSAVRVLLPISTDRRVIGAHLLAAGAAATIAAWGVLLLFRSSRRSEV